MTTFIPRDGEILAPRSPEWTATVKGGLAYLWSAIWERVQVGDWRDPGEAKAVVTVGD
ncbi:MAG: hypothetical protein O2783_07960 [Chloroflexi bacterium]|nr:hypothetical protein [Chloroflexota bacterium]